MCVCMCVCACVCLCLQLHKAPPRPYSDPASTAVLRDILDGYFPAPLRAEFPDGIPIKVRYQSFVSPWQHAACAASV